MPTESKFREVEFPGRQNKKKQFPGYGMTAELFIFVLHRAHLQSEHKAQALSSCSSWLFQDLTSNCTPCPGCPKPILLSCGCNYRTSVAYETPYVQAKTKQTNKQNNKHTHTKPNQTKLLSFSVLII